MQKKKILVQLLPYCLGVGINAIAMVSLVMFDPLLGRNSPLIVFLPAILISSWLGGFRPGITISLLSAIELYYFFTPPYFSFLVKEMSINQGLQFILFVTESILVSFLIDIGKRQKIIIDYRRKEKDLLSQINQLQKEIEKEKEEIRSRDEFLSVASHELKTPLTSMLLQIQTALHNIRNVSLAQFSVENLLRMLQGTEQQTKRLSRMINDLLNVSLITTGRMDLELEEVDLSELVKNVVEDFSTKLEREEYELILEAQPSIVGKWDKVRIEQAISNLISNAIKYGQGNPITVTVFGNGKKGIVSVTDQGIGIPDKQRDRIFGLFQRAVSPTEYRGLGVGLFITNQIVKAHAGKIHVKSTEGRGATFVIELPINPQ